MLFFSFLICHPLCEVALLLFWHAFYLTFFMFAAGLPQLYRLAVRTNWKTFTRLSWLWRSVARHNYLLFFSLQGTPSLDWRNNTFFVMYRYLRQEWWKQEGERWEQSWLEMGTSMLLAALSCHSLASPAGSAQAEVQRLNHRGRSGRPGHLPLWSPLGSRRAPLCPVPLH